MNSRDLNLDPHTCVCTAVPILQPPPMSRLDVWYQISYLFRAGRLQKCLGPLFREFNRLTKVRVQRKEEEEEDLLKFLHKW